MSSTAPADDEGPSTDHGPPLGEPLVVGQGRHDPDHAEEGGPTGEGPAYLVPGHPDGAGQPEGDGEEDGGDDVDQPTDGQADTHPGHSGVPDRPRVRPGAEPAAAHRTGQARTRPGSRGWGTGCPVAWSGCGEPAAAESAPRAQVPWPGARRAGPGAPQCTAPQAESEVSVEDTTANGTCGSRVSSTTGTRLSRGVNGTGGWSNTGRSLGARAAICWTGGATDRGATVAARSRPGALAARTPVRPPRSPCTSW